MFIRPTIIADLFLRLRESPDREKDQKQKAAQHARDYSQNPRDLRLPFDYATVIERGIDFNGEEPEPRIGAGRQKELRINLFVQLRHIVAHRIARAACPGRRQLARQREHPDLAGCADVRVVGDRVRVVGDVTGNVEEIVWAVRKLLEAVARTFARETG